MLLQPTARGKGLTLKIDYDIFLPTRFVADPGRIRQIVTNLMGNAVKFTLEGHVTLRVVGFPANSTSTTLHVSIEDTGIGIAADKVDHVFGEFNQVEDERNRQFEGTGLGLAITKRLIDLMNGEVWVESEEGVGSCFGFSVTFPNDDTDTNKGLQLDEGLRRILVIEPGAEAETSPLINQVSALGAKPVCCTDLKTLNQDVVAGTSLIIVGAEPDDPALTDVAEAVATLETDIPLLCLSHDPKRLEQEAFGDATVLQRPYARKALFDAIVETAKSKPVAAPKEPEHPVSEVKEPSAKPSVLLAEDNKTNQMVFRKMVGKLDIDLHTANDGFQAVAAYKERQPDVIFMDISMPGMDGKEATQKIREIEEGAAQIPIIAVTAHAMAGDRETIMQAGLTDYLTKPLRKDALIEKLRLYCPQVQELG